MFNNCEWYIHNLFLKLKITILYTNCSIVCDENVYIEYFTGDTINLMEGGEQSVA